MWIKPFFCSKLNEKFSSVFGDLPIISYTKEITYINSNSSSAKYTWMWLFDLWKVRMHRIMKAWPTRIQLHWIQSNVWKNMQQRSCHISIKEFNCSYFLRVILYHRMIVNMYLTDMHAPKRTYIVDAMRNENALLQRGEATTSVPIQKPFFLDIVLLSLSLSIPLIKG